MQRCRILRGTTVLLAAFLVVWIVQPVLADVLPGLGAEPGCRGKIAPQTEQIQKDPGPRVEPTEVTEKRPVSLPERAPKAKPTRWISLSPEDGPEAAPGAGHPDRDIDRCRTPRKDSCCEPSGERDSRDRSKKKGGGTKLKPRDLDPSWKLAFRNIARLFPF